MIRDNRRWAWLKTTAKALLVFAGFYFAAHLGMGFMLPEANVAMVWPAAGVALGAVYLFGGRYALVVLLAAFAFHYSMGRGLLPAAVIATGSATAAWLGAILLHRSHVSPALDRLRDVLVFALFGVVLTSSLSSLVGSGVSFLAGLSEWRGFASLWWISWVAEMAGVLLVTPVLVTASRPSPPGRTRRPTELVVLAAMVAVTAWVAYADVLPARVAMTEPLSYLAFPLFIWAGMRFAPRQVAPLLLLYAAVAIGYTAVNQGPFAGGTLREDLLSLHGHLAILGMTVFLLTAALAERGRTNEALRQSEAKYRLLVENQTDLVVKMCPDGRVIFVSPSVCAMFGVSEQELLGRPFRVFMQRAEKAAAQTAWEALRAPPYGCYLEQPVDTPDGERWLAWAGKAVLDQDGRVEAVVAVGRDVTARRAAEAEARQHLEELAHVGRLSAMGEMAAGLAHELNQPLCAIMNFSQASRRLLGGEAPPELRRAIDRVVANAERAGAIIRQMRHFVRREEPKLQNADLNRLVTEVIELVTPQARQQAVALEVALGDELPAVRVAPVQVHQVLVNLIRNALDAIDAAGCQARKVVVETRHLPARGVEVSVTDTGPGVAPGLLDDLFQPFVSSKDDGMGLGLSISRSIIEAHGGKLWLEPRDQGARFRFWLPTTEVQRSHVS